VDDTTRTTGGKSDVTGTRAASRSRISGLWVGLILSAIVLAFLLVFILQNGDPVQITFLGWAGALPTGVALLFAAVAGVLLVAIPGSVRILQLRQAAAGEGARAGRTSHLD
jgi:putative membrane protein